MVVLGGGYRGKQDVHVLTLRWGERTSRFKSVLNSHAVIQPLVSDLCTRISGLRGTQDAPAAQYQCRGIVLGFNVGRRYLHLLRVKSLTP
jgi:hypothetical protein